MRSRAATLLRTRRTVSSPARVPATSGQSAWSITTASAFALPLRVLSTRSASPSATPVTNIRMARSASGRTGPAAWSAGA